MCRVPFAVCLSGEKKLCVLKGKFMHFFIFIFTLKPLIISPLVWKVTDVRNVSKFALFLSSLMMLCNTGTHHQKFHSSSSVWNVVEFCLRALSRHHLLFLLTTSFKGCVAKYGTRVKKLEILLRGEQVRANSPAVRKVKKKKKKHLERLHISIQGLGRTQREL